MKIKFYILLLLIGLAFNANGQADCAKKIIYTGTIKENSIEVKEIGLPTTLYLIDFYEKSEKRAFITTEVKNGKIEETQVSHLGPEFCGDTEDIINDVFKRGRNTFPLIIYPVEGIDKIMVDIPIDDITFKYDKDARSFIINLGEIKIETPPNPKK